MIRRACLALVLLAAACSSPEPVAVPDGFRDTVGALLGVTPSVSGETCASLPVDRPTEGNHRYSAQARVPTMTLESFRAKAIASGWQPQRVADAELALLGPGEIQVVATRAGDGLEVRARVEHRCSTPSPLFRTNSAPDPTPGQVAALEGSFASTSAAIRAVYGEFGQTAARLPEAWTDQARNCQAGAAAGVSWLIPSLPGIDLSEKDIAGRLSRALGDQWEVAAEGESTANGVTTSRIKASFGDLVIPMRVDVFPTGTTTLSFDSIPSGCVPPAP